MVTNALIPEIDAWGSAEPISFEDLESPVGRTTCEVAGELFRKPALLNATRNETQWPDKAVNKTSPPGKPLFTKPLIRLPPGSLPKERVRVLQQWEGVVTGTTKDSFFAELQDLGESSLPLEVVEVAIEEVSKDDRPMLVEGAVFYWSIGYETSPGGQLKRMSEIRLRRTPRWTKRTLELAKKQGEELFELNTNH